MFCLRLHVVRKWSTLWLYLVLSYKCPTLHFLEHISCLLSFRTENERCSKLRSGLRWHPHCTYSVAKTIGWPRYKVHFPLKIRKPWRKLTIHCCNSTHSTQPSSIAIKRVHPPTPPPFPTSFIVEYLNVYLILVVSHERLQGRKWAGFFDFEKYVGTNTYCKRNYLWITE